MASAINAIHPTETNAFTSAKAAFVCDAACRKHADIFTQYGSLPDIEKHPSTIKARKDAGHFDCNICLDGCRDPVVTQHCGHLFCWPCLYSWLSLHSLSKECPVCKANVQDKIIPLYGRGIAEHSINSAAMMLPDILHVPCRPSPSRSNIPVATNAVTDHDGELRNHAIQDYEIHRGFFASILRCVMTSLTPHSGGFFNCERARSGAPIPEQRRWRFSNEKEFVLHWAFIFVASIAIVFFIVL